MQKYSFPAAAEGMPIFNRRSFFQGVGSVGVVAGVVAAPVVVQAKDGRRTAEVAYRASCSAEDRLMHHLLMAGQAMDDMVPDSDCRWLVTMGGKAPFEDRFINAHRFQLMPDPEIKGLMIERMHDVMRWQP